MFYIFANSLMLDVLKDNWILKFVSAFNLLGYIVLVEIYKENSASCRYVTGKWRNIILFFSDDCEYSSLMLHKNPTSGSFLRITVTLNGNFFSKLSMKIHWLHENYYMRMKIHWFIFHFYHTKFCNLMCFVISKIRVYWVVKICPKCWHISLCNIKITFINITTDHTRKVFTYWNIVKLSVLTTNP